MKKKIQVALKNVSIFPELSSDFETIKLMGIFDVNRVAAYEIKWEGSPNQTNRFIVIINP